MYVFVFVSGMVAGVVGLTLLAIWMKKYHPYSDAQWREISDKWQEMYFAATERAEQWEKMYRKNRTILEGTLRFVTSMAKKNIKPTPPTVN